MQIQAEVSAANQPASPRVSPLRDEATLFIHTWTRAIQRLTRECALLQHVLAYGPDTRTSRRLAVVESEISTYKLCSERIREYSRLQTAGLLDEHAYQRKRFYNLMAALAKAENSLAESARGVSLVHEAGGSDPWSGERWLQELREAASATRLALADVGL